MTSPITFAPGTNGALGAPGLEGKVAVITGAGRMRSIGRDVARLLGLFGCDVILVGSGRDPQTFPHDEREVGWQDVHSVAQEVRGTGVRATPVVCDVSDPASVMELVSVALEAHGRVDILVNNAGASRGDDRRPVVDVDPASWSRVIEVNLTGSFLMSQAIGRQMIEQGEGGSIVNISSIAGKQFKPNTAAYAASKAGLQALTACMAREVAQYGIRVNAVCPGLIDTSRMDSMKDNDLWERHIAHEIPLGRAGTGWDVANVVAFLSSDLGSWVTGQSWNIDGGAVVQH